MRLDAHLMRISKNRRMASPNSNAAAVPIFVLQVTFLTKPSK